jgi:hypothetical protein
VGENEPVEVIMMEAVVAEEVAEGVDVKSVVRMLRKGQLAMRRLMITGFNKHGDYLAIARKLGT